MPKTQSLTEYLTSDMEAFASPPRLTLARKNVQRILALLYIQDVFWLIISRWNFDYYGKFYYLANFDWATFLLFALLSTSFVLVSHLTAYVAYPLRRIHADVNWVKFFIFLSVVLNLALLVLVDRSARYSSGGLVGAAGILYAFARAFALASMLIIVRDRNDLGVLKLRGLLALFVASVALTIDGLASALTLMVFVLLLVRRISLATGGLLIVAGVTIFLFGYQMKFSDTPEYLTPSFLFHWAIARFSIQAETAYTYLAGDSAISGVGDYFSIIVRSFLDRVAFITGSGVDYVYPRTVSESIYYDAWGSYGGGSSPGLFLSTLMMGPWLFFLVPLVYSILFMQIMYGMKRVLGWLDAIALIFLTKFLHSDVSELMIAISPVTIFAFVTLIAVLIVPTPRPRVGVSRMPEG